MALETCTLKLACTVVMKKYPSAPKENKEGSPLKKVEKGGGGRGDYVFCFVLKAFN